MVKRKLFGLVSFLYFLIKNKEIEKTVILGYHNIGGQKFERHIKFLKRDHDIISLNEYVENLKRDKNPKNSIVITFDDGYQSHFTDIYPLIQEYEIPITIYINSGLIGREKYKWEDDDKPLTWDQISEMSECEFIAFEAHTANHPNLNKVSLKKAKKEIIEGKKILEKRLNMKVKHFAYPFGKERHYNGDIVDIVRDEFESAVTLIEGENEKRNLFELRRTRIGSNYNIFKLFSSIKGLKKKLVDRYE